MDVTSTDQNVLEIEADAVVVGLYADEPLHGAAAQIDQANGGLVQRLVDAEEISTSVRTCTPLLAVPKVVAGHVLCVGLGPRDHCDAGLAFQAAAAASRNLAAKQRGRVAFFLDDQLPQALAEGAVAGSIVGCQGQDLYRSQKKRFPFEQLVWSLDKGALGTGRVLGDSMNLTRQLINEPPDMMYPAAFADAARKMAAEFDLTVEVWGRQKLQDERCGALLAVARGSSREPQLVIVRYQGAAADAPVLGLVGKGVTFDSGGLSLKPSDSMKTMKCDMAGAATVLGALRAIAALKLPINVTGYMGLVENMTGPDAYKLGDVVTARNGTTIEIHNTDAEGRLVLADTLAVAVDEGVGKLIDLATLTGACVVALGENVAGVMTNDQDWCEAVLDAAEAVGELVWQLPMFSEFDEQIRSNVADIKNTGEGRWGGAITAAKLLEHFVDDVSWTHIDIAGPAFAEKALAWLDGGATGCLVRTLVELARRSPVD